MADSEKTRRGRPKKGEEKRGPGRPKKQPEPGPVKQWSDYPPVLIVPEVMELMQMSRSDVYQKTRVGKLRKVQGLGRTLKYQKCLLPLEMIPEEAFGGVVIGNSGPAPAGRCSLGTSPVPAAFEARAGCGR